MGTFVDYSAHAVLCYNSDIRNKTHTYRVIIEPDGKCFHAYAPALPGCHTFGKTITEAKKHIREAISLYIETLLSNKKTIPSDESFESFETISIGARNRVYA